MWPGPWINRPQKPPACSYDKGGAPSPSSTPPPLDSNPLGPDHIPGVRTGCVPTRWRSSSHIGLWNLHPPPPYVCLFEGKFGRWPHSSIKNFPWGPPTGQGPGHLRAPAPPRPSTCTEARWCLGVCHPSIPLPDMAGRVVGSGGDRLLRVNHKPRVALFHASSSCSSSARESSTSPSSDFDGEPNAAPASSASPASVCAETHLQILRDLRACPSLEACSQGHARGEMQKELEDLVGSNGVPLPDAVPEATVSTPRDADFKASQRRSSQV